MRRDASVVAEELRRARTTAGLSLRTAAAAAGIDHATLWRFERGRNELPVDDIAAVGAVVGLDVRLRAFPAGDPIRDAGQQRLIDRMRVLLHPSLHWRTEVLIAGDAERRAWDAVIGAPPSWWMAVDAETVLSDVQAVERRFNAKQAADSADLVLLLVSDTRGNRRALKAAPAAFGQLTRSAHTVLAALRTGRRPDRSALIFL